MKRLLLLAFYILSITSAYGAQNKLMYTCHGTMAIGFDGRMGNWREANFENKDTFLVVWANNGTEFQMWSPHREGFPGELIAIEQIKKEKASWGEHETYTNTDIFIEFSSGLRKVTINRATLRFSKIEQEGFLTNNQSATPMMQIGFCKSES